MIDTKGLAFVAYDKDNRMVLATSLRHADDLRDFFKAVSKDGLTFELVTDEDVRKGYGEIKGQPKLI